ncbi:zn2 cys6 dna-binding [Trichoderma cornu-damae]|uniref:Zn2 cys6 dna-binding n=1 Tax=Trichoderma cornu-damae TaxID=654480 RepID=A0A9P8TWK1_9HYPO|nr:zn2 cys6 dna-binding [Trichoderma cornu-damae]
MSDDPDRGPETADIGADKGTGDLGATAASLNAEPKQGRTRKKRLQTGRADQCEFETNPRSLLLPSIGQGAQLEQIKSDQAEIRHLRNEIFRLRELLSKSAPQQRGDGDAHAEDDAPVDDDSERNGEADAKEMTTRSNPDPIATTANINKNNNNNNNNNGPPDPREKSPRGYYKRHTLLRFFSEIPQLFPFIKETADQWLKPYGIYIKKHKPSARDDGRMASQEQPLIESLLPPRKDTDVLISIYLNHFEQLHRVVHVPTFNREYVDFWTPGRTRYPTVAAMMLSMMAVSISAPVHLVGPSPIPAAYRNMAEQWISSIDDWLRLQSSKHRKLVHYRVACLVYMARRMNMVNKKRFWKDTGSMIQDAIMDGLHRNPPATDAFFVRETKKRIWHTVRELELQNSFECGLPTLLHSIESNVEAPLNLADEDFDDTTKQSPIARPSDCYTASSYQCHSFRSWALRLEISRRLFGSGFYRALDYGEVLRYTHEITRAIHDLPPWHGSGTDGKGDPRLVLAFSVMEFQLKECLLAIHRPYLDRDDGRYRLSESMCYQTSREILISSIELANLGIQSLAHLREDVVIASLHITRVTLLQPGGSTSIVTANAMSTVDLLEQCLPIVEDKYLRISDPWIFFMMCTAIMLIKIHLGKETRQAAKSSCARRFLDLYYKNEWMHQPSDLEQQQAIAQDIVDRINLNIHVSPQASATYPPPPPDGNALPTLAWLDSSYPDVGNDPFDLAVELDNVWDESGFPLPGFPNC